MNFIYDTNTNNISFLKMAKHLKSQGVKNNKFMLTLYDQSLSGVDVYSENLTADQKAHIYAEACRNWWYFLREILKIPQEGNSDGVHFQLNVGNMAAAYCCKNNINHLLILPRQIGKTVVEVSFSLWVFGFAGTFSTETYLHKAQSGSIDNLGRLKKYKELLPDWLQNMINDHSDKDNLEEKFSAKRKNRIVGLSSASNDASADKLGRGSSTPLLYLDEFAFLERNEIVWKALIPAWMTSAQVAKANNAPYGIRITTTPNNLSLPQASFCYNNIKEKACRFTYVVYDIDETDLESYVHENSGNDFMFIQYTWEECGKTKIWYETQCRLIGDRITIKRELENEWPESSEGNIFSEDQLEKIKHYVRSPELVLTVNGYQILFFEHPDFSMNYIMSCDVSGGLSLDRSVMILIHPADFHVVGLFVNARIDTDAFRNLIFKLATEYFIHAVINIENNSYGLAILDVLMKSDIEPRIYRETVEKQGEKTLRDGTVVKQKSKKVVYGTNTNSQSRKLMYEMLPAIVEDEPENFISEDFYNELKNLYRNKQGKVEARPGFHDDIIMSYLVTRFSLAYGKCFRDRFNIMSIPTKANIHNGSSNGSMLTSFGNIIDQANTLDTSLDNSTMFDNLNQYYKEDNLENYKSPEEQKKTQTSAMIDFISKLNGL